MKTGITLLLGGVVCLAAEEAKVKLPDSTADLARGEKLYQGSCLFCHGPTGEGGKGANLARAKLTRAGTDDDLVRIIENGISGTEMPGSWHMTRREATQVAAYVRTLGRVEPQPVPGEAARGKLVFAGKGGCLACHTVKENGRLVGGLMGPDLSNVGMRRSAPHLRESVVQPSAAAPDGFLQVTVTTKDGKRVTGRRVNEDTFHILVRDYSGNNHSFRKAELAGLVLEPGVSPMPGYRDKLSGAELDDLVAYLVLLREEQ